MTGLELPLALFLLVNLIVALARAARGPTPADRMLTALLFGSTGVGVLVLLAYTLPPDGEAGGSSLTRLALVDVALTLALLAAIAGVAFARRAWHADEGEGRDA
jgi:multicomponent Na+:H+ antiporter subunit F